MTLARRGADRIEASRFAALYDVDPGTAPREANPRREVYEWWMAEA